MFDSQLVVSGFGHRPRACARMPARLQSAPKPGAASFTINTSSFPCSLRSKQPGIVQGILWHLGRSLAQKHLYWHSTRGYVRRCGFT